MITAVLIFTGCMLAWYSPTIVRSARTAIADRPRRPGRHRHDAILRPRGTTMAGLITKLDADADAAQGRMLAAVAAEEGRLNVPAEMRPEGSRPLIPIEVL